MKNFDDFKNDGAQYSPTEEFGLEFLSKKHKRILSVGISTAGFAELRMALDDKSRNIVATTLDENGLDFTRSLIKKYDVNNQFELRIEDIASDLSYEDKYFDFVYARLVLHYLENDKLKKALDNIYRVLSDNGDLVIVVRSYDWESEVFGATNDLNTGLTTYPNFDLQNNVIKTSTRHLHSVGSISTFLSNAGFEIKSLKTFKEAIFGGYERVVEKKNKFPANLIAMHIVKKVN